MIRHPVLLLGELLCAGALALMGHWESQRPVPRPPALRFSLSVLGERELPDGSWQGVDLLRSSDAPADRFQLTIRPSGPARLTIDVLGPHGPQRLYPPAGRDGHLRAGKAYALPGPHAFYRLDGKARVRLSIRPAGRVTGPVDPASPLPGGVWRPYPLSDGARFAVREVGYSAARGGTVTLTLHQ